MPMGPWPYHVTKHRPWDTGGMGRGAWIDVMGIGFFCFSADVGGGLGMEMKVKLGNTSGLAVNGSRTNVHCMKHKGTCLKTFAFKPTGCTTTTTSNSSFSG